jgi:hypothetical protein
MRAILVVDTQRMLQMEVQGSAYLCTLFSFNVDGFCAQISADLSEIVEGGLPPLIPYHVKHLGNNDER